MTKGNKSAYFINSHNLYHRLFKSRLPNGFDKKAPSAKVIFKLTDNWKIKDFSVRELWKKKYSVTSFSLQTIET